MRKILAITAASLCLTAFAHDLVTAETARAWLQELQLASADAKRRGEAAYRSGVVLETIRALLNQDLAAHGEVSGLPSKYLLAELDARGYSLNYSALRRQYLSNSQYFRDALALAPKAAFAEDAGYRLLDGLFYDNFGDDPLGAADASAVSAEMIALVEDLTLRFPAHPRREEIEFIGAILYTRAARICGQNALASDYAKKARHAISEFERRYPASLRAAVMPVLRDALARC